jgi:mpaB/rubber oxygenase-like protein
MDTSTDPTQADLLNSYLARFKPIPLGDQQPSQESLARWAASRLEWLHVGDPLADDVIAVLRQHSGAMANPSAWVQRLADDGDAACTALLAEMSEVPDWVDFDLMRRGGAMAQRQFPMMVLALTYGGVPLTFAHPDAAAVFADTGRMAANISRRLNESGTLFFGVCNSDALAPGKAMWAVCLQVRLVHAMVRWHLLHQGWDVELRGVPVSPLATAAGPAFFGTHILGCLRRLGARISEEEALGHNMIWRYITRLLGVPDVLIGRTQVEQDEFDRHITSLFFAPDDTAKNVMASLIEGLRTLPPTSRAPGDLQLALFRRMLGNEMADAFGIERSRSGERKLAMLLPLLRCYGRIQSWPFLAAPLRRRGQRIIEQLGSEGLVNLDAAGSHH